MNFLPTTKRGTVTTILIISCVGISSAVTMAKAQVMQSSNYQIQSDSANSSGVRSQSPSYTIEDTAGEIATGPSSSTNYQVRAGYQQMQETYLALSPAADVVMSPNIGGITGGTATGNTSVTVTTDNLAGYELSIQASSSPAMQHASGTASIADYAPSGANPDFVFDVDSTASEFGFSPEGSDVSQRFLDNGSSCNVDTGETADRCWDGLSTTETLIARRTSSNHPVGTQTTVNFQAEIGSNVNQLGGLYRATSTITLLAL